MPLTTLKKKISELKLRLKRNQSSSTTESSPCQVTPEERSYSSSSSQGYESSLAVNQVPAISSNGGVECWANVIVEDTTYSEEATLLQQYFSLQHLAISRRHCNQLRRIRDSLALRAWPDANSHSPCPEIQALRDFLIDTGFVQYYSLFNRHGYDLPTAAYMDVLDLAAIGINEPLHRMALKYELDHVC